MMRKESSVLLSSLGKHDKDIAPAITVHREGPQALFLQTEDFLLHLYYSSILGALVSISRFYIMPDSEKGVRSLIGVIMLKLA